MAKSMPYFRLEMLENDILWGGTYPYGLYTGVPPPPPPPPDYMTSLGHRREETVMNSWNESSVWVSKKPNSIHSILTIFHTAVSHAYVLSLVHFHQRIPTKRRPCWRIVCMTSPGCLFQKRPPVWQLLSPPLYRWSQFAATLLNCSVISSAPTRCGVGLRKADDRLCRS